jgi:uncharacterized protein YbjT (DUF2867 family)
MSQSSLENHQRPASVITIADSYPLDSLITAFKGQDAVVNAITSFYVAQQHNSIDAAIAAGVKRYLPSEYGLDNNNPEAQELSPYSGMLQQYLRSKESSGLTWTAIACRMWIGWYALRTVDTMMMTDCDKVPAQ